jgi:hypothetical protein
MPNRILTPRLKVTRCPISIAVAFLEPLPQPLPRAGRVFSLSPGGWKP